MKNANAPTVMTSPEYRQFIEDLKMRVNFARISVARAVNRDLILLYWDIGREIVEKQQTLGWGDAVVQMVAADLRRAFPEMRGFSLANVWRMRQLHMVYSSEAILAQAVRELAAPVPWGHHVLLLGRIKSPPELLYYLRATARFGWSRNVLLNQIKAGTYERAVTEKKTHNCRAGGSSRTGHSVTKHVYRYQPPTPAKELLAEFWKLEREAEKMLEGLAK
ncbi:MAG: DUF1016 N-terminal domain-containing protein [Acidobacteria bacterium]|nr:DUF1016 N-terminal domain-containing protein [Acidobacteriota bacterium]